MTPRLVVRYFGPGAHQQWARLVRVLAHTARRHCPDWQHDIESVAPLDPTLYSQRGVQGHVWNTHKLDLWSRVVHEAEDGAQILLLDADTVITRPIDDVWDLPFDVAYTVKPNSETRRFPLNGGVLFLRVSDRSRRFMEGWQAQNRAFLADDREYAVWAGAYGGINQAALGVFLRSKPALDLRKLPCLEWNNEDEHWSQFDPDVTRILHIKSALQAAIMRMVKPDDDIRPLVRLWRQLESDAMNHDVTPSVGPMIKPSDLQNTIVTSEDLTNRGVASTSPTVPPIEASVDDVPVAKPTESKHTRRRDRRTARARAEEGVRHEHP